MKHLLIALLLVTFALPAKAAVGEHIADIQKAEDFLRGLNTLQADFIMKSSTGTRLSGKFMLDRPGRLRFDYNEVEDFIVADGFFIYFYDSQMQQQTNAPIGQTLADFLLRDNLRLSGDVTITNVSKQNGMTALTLVQSDEPAAGSIQLFFSDVPYRLTRWIVKDPSGGVTEILLKNIERDVKFSRDTFAYLDPKLGQPRYNQ